ncbi:MAG TPA: PP2C family serine/threonine-protein phosphatase [Gemmataceae bacterium]|nr:PP2C family serine/threonine-protein phosphatase [Gemmataceae bacterium]
MRTLALESEAAAPLVTDLELVAGPVRLDVESFGLTDRGRVRPSNEDNFLIADLADSPRQSAAPDGAELGHLLAVADGVGGNCAGERASRLAVLGLEPFLLDALAGPGEVRGLDGDGLTRVFQEAVRRAQEALFQAVARRPDWRGMGTTLTLAYVWGRELFVAHVGDSRAYLLRDGELRQLTQDHTLVAELVRHGVLSPAEVAHHPYRHVIINSVGGTEPGLRVATTRMELHPDDVLLLCSDGLTEMLPDERIRDVVRAEADLERACTRLVAEANEAGGKDNVTVVLARFREGVDVELVAEEDDNERR